MHMSESAVDHDTSVSNSASELRLEKVRQLQLLRDEGHLLASISDLYKALSS